MALYEALAAELAALQASARLRRLHPYGGVDRARPVVNDSTALVSFSSNDYLGLASHPRVREAAAASALSLGVGSGASRLVSGGTPAHQTLEDSLAALMSVEAALLFPSGYQANLGVLTALAGPEDFIASDALNHASLIDGCRLSRARVGIFEHANPESASRCLAKASAARRRFVLTESLFSMDGDRAPLLELDQVCRRHDASLIVDEAHAFGTLGPSGRGLCAAENVHPALVIGTLGKATGAAGGFVASSRVLCDFLVNRARMFIYTTAPPGPIVAATQAALTILASGEGDQLRATLRLNIARLRSTLPSRLRSTSTDHIVPIILGSDEHALLAARHLLDAGILVPAIRPPTVPENTARLRITLSAAHTQGDLAKLVQHLGTLPGSEPASTHPDPPDDSV